MRAYCNTYTTHMTHIHVPHIHITHIHSTHTHNTHDTHIWHTTHKIYTYTHVHITHNNTFTHTHTNTHVHTDTYTHIHAHTKLWRCADCTCDVCNFEKMKYSGCYMTCMFHEGPKLKVLQIFTTHSRDTSKPGKFLKDFVMHQKQFSNARKHSYYTLSMSHSKMLLLKRKAMLFFTELNPVYRWVSQNVTYMLHKIWSTENQWTKIPGKEHAKDKNKLEKTVWTDRKIKVDWPKN